ncbi:DUF6497 family protein [Salipiger mucosus]|uniref:Acetolactate synthase n=1 Tax=Salipiger mucosus DSM 16094 TaxID=1123237 RepID=S9QUW7_9RHOB|nr:DUF6497 family protein [Salipiger mucosus]EPX85161.1 Acetolactate synthase [Salipiger mucosus DSM 16094]
MNRVASALGLLACAFPPAAHGAEEDGADEGGLAAFKAPSGMEVTLQETFWDDPGRGAVYRFRFVAPGLAAGEDSDLDSLAGDMTALCEDIAVPAIRNAEPAAFRVVISLMAEPVPFGESTPGVRQVFESYSLEDGRCIWEVF